MNLSLAMRQAGSGDACRAVLATLPTWFGIEEANADYFEKADTSPTLLASIGDAVVGLLIAVRHFPTAAEIHLMAVVAEHHRKGIGRAMLDHAEVQLAADGVRFLQVKTLSPSSHDEGYDKTRQFYLSVGFEPLEEFPELWDPSNPALQMIKTIG